MQSGQGGKNISKSYKTLSKIEVERATQSEMAANKEKEKDITE